MQRHLMLAALALSALLTPIAQAAVGGSARVSDWGFSVQAIDPSGPAPGYSFRIDPGDAVLQDGGVVFASASVATVTSLLTGDPVRDQVLDLRPFGQATSASLVPGSLSGTATATDANIGSQIQGVPGFSQAAAAVAGQGGFDGVTLMESQLLLAPNSRLTLSGNIDLSVSALLNDICAGCASESISAFASAQIVLYQQNPSTLAFEIADSSDAFKSETSEYADGAFVNTDHVDPSAPQPTSFSLTLLNTGPDPIRFASGIVTIVQVEHAATTAPVPEPSTFALMGLGLGAVGWAGKRGRRTAR